jgi:Uma2 family endonuclease
MNTNVLANSKKIYTTDEYLSFENNSLHKNEYLDGKISASNGTSRTHNLISSNITIAVGSRLRKHKSDLYVNSMRVKLSDNAYCYPDIVIVKDEPKFENHETDILLNPTVIIEIVSKATYACDKTTKLEKYLTLESINEYLLVSEDKMFVEHYARQGINQWVYRIYNTSDAIVSMDSIMCKINISEFYTQIKY